MLLTACRASEREELPEENVSPQSAVPSTGAWNISAVYDQDGVTYGRSWEGETRFRVSEKYGFSDEEQAVITEDLVDRMCFNGPFSLYSGDYNEDGRSDFLITQFGSSSGGDYGAVVTLNLDGTVERLPVNGDRRSISAFGMISLTETETGTFLLPYIHTFGSVEPLQIEGGFAVDCRFLFGTLKTGICCFSWMIFRRIFKIAACGMSICGRAIILV